MKASELRNREIADLNILLLDKLKEQFNLRAQPVSWHGLISCVRCGAILPGSKL